MVQQDAEDRLTKLPAELLHNIFDYLFVRHRPDQLTYYNGPWRPCNHELDKVSATCKILRNEVNDWAIHFLVQHQDITRYKPPKQTVKRDKTFNALRGRGGQGLLSWAEKHCIVCGKTTKCSAVMVNGLKSCKKCDRTFWPKMTKTDACKEFDLKPYHLLPRRYGDCAEVETLQARFPDGPPRIHYGTYDAMGVTATAFLRKDVEWLARVYHGDLEAHLDNRKAKSDARKLKMEERRREKAAAERKAAAKALVEGTGPATHAVTAGATASVPFWVDDSDDGFDD